MEEAEIIFNSSSPIWYSPKTSEGVFSFNTSKQSLSYLENGYEANQQIQESYEAPTKLSSNEKLKILDIQDLPEFHKINNKLNEERIWKQTETCKR